MKSKIKFKSKIFYYFLFILYIFLCIFFSFSGTCFAGYPKLVNNIVSAFEKVEKYIVAISTPAAAVSIGCGFLMQKFSFGDEERIRIGKKLIKGSLFSYAFVLVINLVLSAIQSLLT